MRLLIDHNEKDLIVSLRQGDMKAFEELYYRYIPRLMAFARTFIFDEQEAEEAVQEIFVKIWEKRKSLDESKNFKSYLFQSVKNHFLNVLRDRKKNCQIDTVPDEYFSRNETVLEDLNYKELEEAVFGLIRGLPKVQQEIFTLSRIEGLDSKEIAMRLNLSKRTVEHHIYLASKSLKGELMQKMPFYTILILSFFAL